MIFYDFFGPGITAAFSERGGGVAPMPGHSLNLSFSREPGGVRENVTENYRIAASALGTDVGAVTRMPQVHGSSVLRVTAGLRGAGVTEEIPRELLEHGFDALITDVPGIMLSTTHADCTPVLLSDPGRPAVGAVHSGWKGTCLKISSAAVKRMTAEFGSEPRTMRAVIGPAISMKHFEVRRDVMERFCDAFGEKELRSAGLLSGPSGDPSDPRWHVDMPGCVKLTLLEAGLSGDNIFASEACTYSDAERFFSHRRDGAGSGAMAAFIGIDL